MCPHCWEDECEGDETGHCPLDPEHPDNRHGRDGDDCEAMDAGDT